MDSGIISWHLKRTNLRQNTLLRHSILSWLLLLLVYEFFSLHPPVYLCMCHDREKERGKKEFVSHGVRM